MSELLKEDRPIRERFVVDNDMKAEWCLSKIRTAKKNAEREIEELTRQMEFYKARMDQVQQEYEEERNFFQEMLLPYFNNRVESGFAKESKTQVSYPLPTGKLLLKHREPEYDYKTKQKEAIEWLKKNDGKQFIKVKEELDWKALKATVTVSGNGVCNEGGEVIPGITVTNREDEFIVEVS